MPAPITTTNKRRRAQGSPSPEPALKKKRMGPAASTKQAEVIQVPDDEEPSTFHLAVKLHSKFENFPEKLRAILTDSYKATTLSQMNALHTHKEQKPTQYYILRIGGCAIPSTAGNIMTPIPTTTSKTPHLSIANTQLLEAFVAKYGTGFGKSSFVELPTQEGMGNKQFIELHSVRHGEVGWGFDTYGCLSLYSARREKSVLRKVVYFIDREAPPVKVEID